VPRRNDHLRIGDILQAIQRIEQYTDGMSFEAFVGDERTVDAVVRNFEVLGEAARHVSEKAVQKSPGIPWLDIRGMRNVLMHEYFGVDLATVWKTIREDLNSLRTELEALLLALDTES